MLWLLSLPHGLPLPAKTADTFRIGAINLNYENHDSQSATEALINTAFDLMIVLEYTGKNLDADALRAKNYRILLNEPRAGTHGICLIAHNTLKVEAQLLNAPVAGPCDIPLGVARLILNGQPVTIIGLHAPPPVPVCKNTTVPTLNKIVSWIEAGRLITNIGPGKKGDRAIVLGDFNMFSFLAWAKKFRSAGMIEALQAGSWRLTPTWSPKGLTPALLQLDYLFLSNEYTVLAGYTIDIPGSDHRAVVADFR